MGLDWPSKCQPATEKGAASPDTTDHTWDPGDVFRVSVGAEADIDRECKMCGSTPQLLLPSDSPVRPGHSVTVVHTLQKALCIRTFRVSQSLHFFPRPPQELRNETGQRIWFVLEVISL